MLLAGHSQAECLDSLRQPQYGLEQHHQPFPVESKDTARASIEHSLLKCGKTALKPQQLQSSKPSSQHGHIFHSATTGGKPAEERPALCSSWRKYWTSQQRTVKTKTASGHLKKPRVNTNVIKPKQCSHQLRGRQHQSAGLLK